jgi:hypothetical protein
MDYDSPSELPIFTTIMDDFRSLLEGSNYGEKTSCEGSQLRLLV